MEKYYKGIINIEASKTMTKEQIFEAVKSGLTTDFNEFYIGLLKEQEKTIAFKSNPTGNYPKDESPIKPSKESKKS